MRPLILIYILMQAPLLLPAPDQLGNHLILCNIKYVFKTILSCSSRSSTRSSKNRRKEERKKQDLREGGVYEDIALIRALHVLIEATFKMGAYVRELCLVLLELDMRKEGKYLHTLLIEIQHEMADNVKDIWTDPTAIINDENFDVLGKIFFCFFY